MKYFLGAATAALLLAGASTASAAQASASVSASATVISPLSETVKTNIDFGKLVLDSTGAAGTLVMTTGGSRSVTGGVNLVGGSTGQAGEVDFVGDTTDGGNSAYDVQVPATATLSASNGHDMSVDITTSTSPGTGLTNLTGSQAITIGGTLHVGANQPAAVYTGSFLVTGNYE